LITSGCLDHLAERGTVKEMPGCFRGGALDEDRVAGRQDGVERDRPASVDLGCDHGVMEDHLHSECLQARGDGAADPAEPDDAGAHADQGLHRFHVR
jgi:hypothetical protein